MKSGDVVIRQFAPLLRLDVHSRQPPDGREPPRPHTNIENLPDLTKQVGIFLFFPLALIPKSSRSIFASEFLCVGCTHFTAANLIVVICTTVVRLSAVRFPGSCRVPLPGCCRSDSLKHRKPNGKRTSIVVAGRLAVLGDFSHG